jgi:hypothetical protein
LLTGSGKLSACLGLGMSSLRTATAAFPVQGGFVDARLVGQVETVHSKRT